VKRITIDPPVYSDSLEQRYWGEIDSICWIELKDGSKVRVVLIPNGLKLRIARVLDPKNYPPEDFESAKEDDLLEDISDAH
jgi:hypothetical protein